jgi:hypothetical protein
MSVLTQPVVAEVAGNHLTAAAENWTAPPAQSEMFAVPTTLADPIVGSMALSTIAITANNFGKARIFTLLVESGLI